MDETVREQLNRLLHVGRWGRRDVELDAEMRFHLEELSRDLEARGLDPASALIRAEREFGGLNRTKQAWRDQRTWVPLEELVQDVRYAIRVLRRSLTLTALAGAMLALAIAAGTSLFTVVDAVLLAPLPYPRAGQLVVVYEAYLTLRAPNVSVTPGTFLEWQDRARGFAAFTAIDTRRQNLTSDGEPEQVGVAAVSRGFAPTVGVSPAIGRLFRDDEFQSGRAAVALLSHALWTSRYGQANVLGRRLVLDDVPYTIVGVLPPAFMFPNPAARVWVPLPMTEADRENRTGHTLFAMARLRDGVSVPAGARELHAVAAALQREYPASNKEWDVTVQPARDALVGKTGQVLKALTGAVALLLVVACANVAGLLVTHGVARRRELAIRAALGASRLRVVRQLLTESVILGLVGTAVGVFLAWITGPVLTALAPPDLLTWKPIRLDARAIVFAAGAGLAAAGLFGTLPAIIASRAHIGRGSAHLRQWLVAIEVALAVVLVGGAALLGQTLARLTSVDLGFQPDGVVTMTLALPPTRFADDTRVDAFYRALFERLRGLPGVRAGAVQALPLSGNTSVRPYQVDGGPSGLARPVAHYRIVSPGYVEAMRIPLRAGRTFTDLDTADRPLVVVVNETLRRQAWGDRNPVGARITFGGAPDKWAQVVGVVADVRHFGPGTAAPPEMYWPSAQIDAIPGETLRRMRRNMTLVVAADRDPVSVVPEVCAAVQAIDPDQPIATVRTMASLVGASLWLSRAAAWLVAIFGTSALAFALLGVFGAAAYGDTTRRRELAVRMALGAAPQKVTRLVLGGALRAAIGGIGAGLLVIALVRHSIAGRLVEIDAADPPVLVLVACVVAAATALASWVPARRAGRIDPMQALRVE